MLFDRLDGNGQPVHEVNIENRFDADPAQRRPRVKQRNGRDIFTFTRHQFEPALGADIYGRVNTYAALWTQEEVVFYFGPDRNSIREIYRVPTPDDVHVPMYVLANDQFTARGGIWPADAALAAVLDPRNDFLIRAIRVKTPRPALQLDMARGDSAFDQRRSQIRDTAGDDIIAPGGGFDIVTLSGGADEIRIHRGREGTVIEGFGGDDRLVLEGFPFTDSLDAFSRLSQVGADVWLSSGADPFWPQSVIFRDRRVADFVPAQIVSRWPVGEDVWRTRADLKNRSETDTDGDGVLTAAKPGGWLNDKGRATRLVGGPGPERYLVSHPQTRISEPAGGNIDTLIAWGRRSLPSNVERGILRGAGGRLTGTPGDDRLEAEGHGGQLSGGAGDDLYVIAETARNTVIRIEDAPGHDRLRGFSAAHELQLAPSLRANSKHWRREQIDEGLLLTFADRQSLLIEGLDLLTFDTLLKLP